MLNMNYINKLQKELSNLLGISGYEEEVSDFILNEIESIDLVDQCWKDPLGNVLAIKKGNSNENRILLDAHMDEIGFMVSHLEEKGFLRFVLIGGWDKRILLGESVVIKSETGEIFHGIIGSKPPHLTSEEERKKIVDISDMYIDLGMTSEKELMNHGINVGIVGTTYNPYKEFPNGMVRGKAFDDRTGCNVLLNVMKILKENHKESQEETILFNFAVQEEIGGRGAMTGSYSLKPTMALAIENTTAADVPGVKESNCPAYIGKGPAITIADHSLISNPKVNQRLIKNAEHEKIPYQIKKPKYGGTDAGKIHTTRKGIPSSVVSVPCRYIHTATSLLKLEDIANTIKLIDAFIRNPRNV